MKKLTTSKLLTALTALVMLASACQKQATDSASESEVSSSAKTVSSTSILVAATVSTSTSSTAAKDSLALMNACPPGGKKDTVAFSVLPTAISTYLTTNYAGYTFQKAFKIVNRSGVLEGYVVAINFNGKPVGLKFDTVGTFVQVLEQRERPDMAGGPGWHKGGRFENRGGLRGDTLVLSALPATIKTYMATNYGTDTLLHAVVTRNDTTYIVVSTNKGLFATAFTSKLVFIKRVQLNARPAKHAPIDPATLPAAVTTYLTTTYPGYVLDKAFAQKQNGAVSKYIVLIDASGTRYAVEFDGTGKFVKSTAVR